MIKYTQLDSDYLALRFPELKDEIVAEQNFLEDFLPHCLYGNILNPLMVRLLMKEDFMSNELLKRIFLFYEELASEGDEEAQNMLQVTLLEYLWDEKQTFDRSL